MQPAPVIPAPTAAVLNLSAIACVVPIGAAAACAIDLRITP
jgi:hypothetical protein